MQSKDAINEPLPTSYIYDLFDLKRNATSEALDELHQVHLRQHLMQMCADSNIQWIDYFFL